ncbi:MAG: stress response serine/threonine protein kinase YihE [Gammaproteobacteria bacterium RIFCSPHIGHO2_12_FULL_40_19]|nr:MAG: stress response serine/threonine protein kinase YihE [Gammaproteobacteria bacterium RIFCSPHIGHO2_12_FULL_40_19]
MNQTNTPYANLEPDLILNAVESLSFHCTGSLFPLNSYENRVYQIGIEDAEPLIVKFYRPFRWTNEAIIEEHQFALELVTHEIPVIAPLAIQSGDTLHTYQGFRFALFPRQGGRALELDNLEQLEWMGRFIGRLHAVGACQAFQHRIKLDTQSYGHEPYHFLLEHDFIPQELKQNFCDITETVLQKIQQRFLQVDPVAYIRLHGDCHAGNVLWNSLGPQIVDLDDCLMGPAIQDIWMLLSGSKQDTDLQLNHILRGYRKFHDFNSRELQLIEAMRSLRMIHYSSWLAKRWEDPAFPLNFPWFNTARYWQDQLQNLRDQAELLDCDDEDF